MIFHGTHVAGCSGGRFPQLRDFVLWATRHTRRLAEEYKHLFAQNFLQQESSQGISFLELSGGRSSPAFSQDLIYLPYLHLEWPQMQDVTSREGDDLDALHLQRLDSVRITRVFDLPFMVGTPVVLDIKIRLVPE